MTLKKSICILIFSLIITIPGLIFAQSASTDENNAPQTLRDQFNDMKDNSETYTEYKVIKISKLNSFWKVVSDTLLGYRKDINELKSTIDSQKAQASSLNNKIEDLQKQLDDSNFYRDRISLFGINMLKETYNIFLWTIIIGLAVLAGILFTSFRHSSSVTREKKRDYNNLHEEFEAFRKRAQEREIKLGRDLQTEINLNEELRNKLNAKKERSQST